MIKFFYEIINTILPFPKCGLPFYCSQTYHRNLELCLNFNLSNKMSHPKLIIHISGRQSVFTNLGYLEFHCFTVSLFHCFIVSKLRLKFKLFKFALRRSLATCNTPTTLLVLLALNTIFL